MPDKTTTPQTRFGALLTPAEAAKYCGRSERALEDDRRSGRGPRYLKLGRRGPIRYPKQFLDDWLEDCVCTPRTADPADRGGS